METDAGMGMDPYKVLGVPADASRAEIVHAYRRGARDAHPDARPADPRGAGRFQSLTEAYDLLSDTGRRAEYDRSRARRPGIQPSAPAAFAAARGARVSSGPTLWAGPVHIEPAPRRPGSPVGQPPADPADVYDLLGWFVSRMRGWPR